MMYEATEVWLEAMAAMLPLALLVGIAMFLTMAASDRNNAARAAAQDDAATGTGAPPPSAQEFDLVFWKPDGVKVSETVYGPEAARKRFFELDAEGRTVHIEAVA